MDNKIIAIIIVAVLAVGGIAAFVLINNNGDGDNSLSIIGRVNTEGSGIILIPSEDPEDYITTQFDEPGLGAKFIYNPEEEVYYVFHPEYWGGKVFATPGAATIQHVQLMDLANLMGLKFVSYTDGATLSSDTLYYIAGVPSFAEFENKIKTAPLVGYIIWEAQYSVGLISGYNSLAKTNGLFNDHTCCIIGSSNKYLEKNTDAVKAFLYVYVQAVQTVQQAISNPDSEDYEKLVDIAMKRVSMPDSLTTEQKRETIMNALENVTYCYADDSTGSLNALKNDIAKLAEDLYTSKQIQYSAKDLGFDSYTALGNKFVVDTYMKAAITEDVVILPEKTKMTVAVIGGDIHQIAIWYAIDTEMFKKVNLEIEISQQSNGPGVYGLLSNGEADLGFLGAPPMTIRSMNAEQVHA